MSIEDDGQAPAKKSLEVIYSTQKTGFEEGKTYANPRFFSSPRAGVTKVHIHGHHPHIAVAYKKLGVPVVQIDAKGNEVKSKAPSAAEATEAPDPGKVAIPAKWDELNWQALRKLATDLGATVTNKADAVAAIETELKLRAAA